MPDDKLDALIAELQAIEVFDRAGEESGLKDQISRAGFETRGMRRLEIIREIDVLMKKKDEGDKAGGQDAVLDLNGPATARYSKNAVIE